jgi:anti-sigma regulatory factor (Ser/Thr protein kinase)
VAIHAATALSRATGIPIPLSLADSSPLENTSLAPPAAPDWGLALGISAAGFAARAFTCDAASLKSVRHFVRETISDWGLAPFADDMTTVVGELAANAIRHALAAGDADTKAWLGMVRTGGAVVCAVVDPSPAPPSRRCPDHLAETGRGLLIVDALTSQWGYCAPDPHGKTVWARIAIPSS